MAIQQQRKALVFIAAGLGDAILLIPLARLLRQQGYSVTAIVTSPFPCEQLFEGTAVFDHLIIARTRARKAWLALKEYRNYQLAIVNYFAANRSNLMLAKQMATMVHANRVPEGASSKLESGIVFFKPKPGIPDAEQNILLAGLGAVAWTEALLHIPRPERNSIPLPSGFLALQISANHNKETYKNWPVAHWISFLKRCKTTFPALHFVLLGDISETALGEEVLRADTGNVQSLIGKTTITQAAEVIGKSSLFVGLDGGLMHIAAAQGIPTFTLWGPSNPLLYGYEQLNPRNNKICSLQLSCSPCSAWISPNTSRYAKPEDCPTRECLADLPPARVFTEFSTFAKTHALV